MTFQTQSQLLISSNNSDAKSDNSFSFYIPTGSIQAEAQEHILLSVQSAILPYTFYNINSHNNTLCYALTTNNIKQFLTLPLGNYNIKDIVNYINENMTNFSVEYNKKLNKLKFINLSSTNFIFYPQSTIYNVLGFALGLTYLSNNGILESKTSVNLNSIQYINIKLNMNTNNITKYNINDKNIFCSIPVNINPYSVIIYTNTNNFRVNTLRNELSEIIIQFADQNGNNINFNGAEWSLVLQFDIYNFVV